MKIYCLVEERTTEIMKRTSLVVACIQRGIDERSDKKFVDIIVQISEGRRYSMPLGMRGALCRPSSGFTTSSPICSMQSEGCDQVTIKEEQLKSIGE